MFQVPVYSSKLSKAHFTSMYSKMYQNFVLSVRRILFCGLRSLNHFSHTAARPMARRGASLDGDSACIRPALHRRGHAPSRGRLKPQLHSTEAIRQGAELCLSYTEPTGIDATDRTAAPLAKLRSCPGRRVSHRSPVELAVVRQGVSGSDVGS